MIPIDRSGQIAPGVKVVNLRNYQYTYRTATGIMETYDKHYPNVKIKDEFFETEEQFDIFINEITKQNDRTI